MKLIPFYGVMWESNSFLLINGAEAVLIDAGVEHKKVLECLEREGAKLRAILLTHGHFDHTVSVDALRRETGAKLLIHQKDDEMLTDAKKSALFLFFGTQDRHGPADVTLEDGQQIPFGDKSIRVIHTPGHSLGSVCYLVDNLLFSGDTIFESGYGRCDLHGGDLRALAASLGKLKTLDGNLTIYPGHGGAATLSDAIESLFGLD